MGPNILQHRFNIFQELGPEPPGPIFDLFCFYVLSYSARRLRRAEFTFQPVGREAPHWPEGHLAPPEPPGLPQIDENKVDVEITNELFSAAVSDRRRDTPKWGHNRSESLCDGLWAPCWVFWIRFGLP